MPTMIRKIVLYTLPDRTQRPAIVIGEEWSDEAVETLLDLEVFGPVVDHEPFPTGVRFEGEGRLVPGTWSY